MYIFRTYYPSVLPGWLSREMVRNLNRGISMFVCKCLWICVMASVILVASNSRQQKTSRILHSPSSLRNSHKGYVYIYIYIILLFWSDLLFVASILLLMIPLILMIKILRRKNPKVPWSNFVPNRTKIKVSYFRERVTLTHDASRAKLLQLLLHTLRIFASKDNFQLGSFSKNMLWIKIRNTTKNIKLVRGNLVNYMFFVGHHAHLCKRSVCINWLQFQVFCSVYIVGE